MPGRRVVNRKETSEISPLIKYLLFGFNVIFWLVGFILFGIGVYAWIEKETFRNLSNLSIGVFFDPAFVFLVVGFMIFILGFIGCIGALRENTFLLLLFSFALGIIFFAELAISVLAYLYKEKVRSEIKANLILMIRYYHDDADLKDLIDWIQRDWLKCCGIIGPDDWNQNSYFSCESKIDQVQACGVPYTCCLSEWIGNNQCGYGSRNKNLTSSINTVFKISQDGCLKKGEEWLSYHILTVSIVVVCLAVLQILGVCFAQNLRNDIKLQKTRWLYNR